MDGSSGGAYGSIFTPALGDAATLDYVSLQVFGGTGFNGGATGTFNLGSGADANYATCSRCALVYEDVVDNGTTSTPTRIYFQSGGTLTVNAGSTPLAGKLNGTLSDVTLVEVTIDPTTYTSTPVAGGACLHITSAPVAVTWNCNTLYWNDGDCDCGCGSVDIDCPDATSASCDYCDDIGSCNVLSCPGTINATNNAVCGP